jgi:hypothetical protein
MADHWFMQRYGQRYGPFAFPQFQQMTTTGQLLPGDLVAQAEDVARLLERLPLSIS